MYKKLTLIVLLLSICSCGQQGENKELKEKSTTYTFREIDKMAVFDGCNSDTSLEDIKKCFSEKMNLLLVEKMKEKMQHYNLPNGVVLVNYTIGKEGKLKAISGQGNEVILPVVLSIFDEINQTISYQPALKNGVEVDLLFAMPVRIKN